MAEVQVGHGEERRDRSGHRPPDAGVGSVPHDARQLGDERVDRDGRQGRRHHGHRHPDRHHALHAGDGVADDHRRQDRPDHRPQARLHDRVRRSTAAARSPRRIAPNLARADLRLVVPRGRRRRADHARHRRPRRVELRPHGAAPCLRARGVGRRHRRRRRSAHRRALHHLPVVAPGVRRRGPRGDRDPRPDAGGWPTPSPRSASGSTSSGPVCRRSGLGLVVVRHPQGRRVGLRASRRPTRRSWLGLSPVDLADPGWRHRARGCSSAGSTDCSSAARSRSSTPPCSTTSCCAAGSSSFFFQYLLQAGLFFTVPLFLSVALGLSAIDTGVRLLPLSITLLLAAVGIPKLLPERVAPAGRAGRRPGACFAGIVVMVASLDAGRRPRDRDVAHAARRPRRRGAGLAARRRHGVRRCPTSRAARSAGCRTRCTNLGASIGTALAGAVLISALTATFLTGIEDNPDGARRSVSEQAEVRARRRASRSSPTPTSRPRSRTRGSTGHEADAIVEENEAARIDGLQASLSVLALIALLALFSTRRIPDEPMTGAAPVGAPPALPTSPSCADGGPPGGRRGA